ncbi:MAG: hypothetical protein M3O36_15190 [Myxococcota bacterium]|nr:hypothetical protein [Myxococcota bacterium]
MRTNALLGVALLSFASFACGSPPDTNRSSSADAGNAIAAADAASGATSGGQNGATAGTGDAEGGTDAMAQAGSAPMIGGCPVLPRNHVFNTPIDNLPVHPSSAAFSSTIGAHNLHLDLGATVDGSSPTYYGIPYDVVHGASAPWVPARYFSADKSLSWDPTPESDCAAGSAHALVRPCLAAGAPQPLFPIPASPHVEGGIIADPAQPYGDHHMLLLDADACRLWELYHAYPDARGGWDIYGSASFDLRSSDLRPDGWTSADAAGFPILPLLLRADEASAGVIRHALRFTIQSNKIRVAYTWPARHLTSNGTASTNLPPMGQLLRLKASVPIPTSFGVQARAILQALKTYGMYLADGGSDLYVSGEPNAAWADATIAQVQSVSSSQFEAVDLSPLMRRPGFDANSGAVPP